MFWLHACLFLGCFLSGTWCLRLGHTLDVQTYVRLATSIVLAAEHSLLAQAIRICFLVWLVSFLSFPSSSCLPFFRCAHLPKRIHVCTSKQASWATFRTSKTKWEPAFWERRLVLRADRRTRFILYAGRRGEACVGDRK